MGDQLVEEHEAGGHSLGARCCFGRHRLLRLALVQKSVEHEAVMTVRRLNGVKPFPMEAIRAHALPELARNLLDNPNQEALWHDDRWNDS